MGVVDLISQMLYDQVVPQLAESTPKYRQIYDSLKDSIAGGQYRTGDRLPSESELVRTFSASRLTVNRALRELQLAGFIERRVGSGSYVSTTGAPGLTFGLLIPELGVTEIFEPICRGMAEVELADHHVLLWGKSPDGHLGNNLGTIAPRHRENRAIRADQEARRVNNLDEPALSAKPPPPVQIRAAPPIFSRVPPSDVNTDVNSVGDVGTSPRMQGGLARHDGLSRI